MKAVILQGQAHKELHQPDEDTFSSISSRTDVVVVVYTCVYRFMCVTLLF